MIKQKEKIIDVLRELVYRFSPEYLLANPVKVYTILSELKHVGENNCVIINRLLTEALIEIDWTNFSNSSLHDVLIQKCNFDEKTADELVDIMSCVYTDDMLRFWNEKNYPGLLQFVRQIMGVEWDGHLVKRKGSKDVEYSYNAKIELLPCRDSVDNKVLLELLNHNPDMSKKDIQMFFAEKIGSFLDEAFELFFSINIRDACADDFPIDLYLNMWCDNYGFELDNYDGHGNTQTV